MKQVLPPPEIVALGEKKLTGISMKMSFAFNKTPELWRSFMPRRKEILNATGNDMFSVQLYDHGFFENFDPGKEFEKRAAAEVTDHDHIPQWMEAFILPAGLYAVFHYRGNPAEGDKIFRYILGEWLPQSGFILDDRPHFEILGEKYSNISPDSEEDIFIPVRPAHASFSIAPWLTVRSGTNALDFYKSAFGAVVTYLMEGEGDDIVARLSVGGVEFWVSNGQADEKPAGPANFKIVLTVPDPEMVLGRSLEAGAKLVYPVSEQYGWRVGRITDPDGFDWEICKQI